MSKTKGEPTVRTLAAKLGYFTELLPTTHRDAFVNLVIDVAEMDKVADDAPVAWAIVRQIAHAVEYAGVPLIPPSQERPATAFDLGPDMADSLCRHLPLDVLNASLVAWRKRHAKVAGCHPHCHPENADVEGT